ncbi:hypothetical protein U0070_011402, partial [Myodes glareolus]
AGIRVACLARAPTWVRRAALGQRPHRASSTVPNRSDLGSARGKERKPGQPAAGIKGPASSEERLLLIIPWG